MCLTRLKNTAVYFLEGWTPQGSQGANHSTHLAVLMDKQTERVSERAKLVCLQCGVCMLCFLLLLLFSHLRNRDRTQSRLCALSPSHERQLKTLNYEAEPNSGEGGPGACLTEDGPIAHAALSIYFIQVNQQTLFSFDGREQGTESVEFALFVLCFPSTRLHFTPLHFTSSSVHPHSHNTHHKNRYHTLHLLLSTSIYTSHVCKRQTQTGFLF